MADFSVGQAGVKHPLDSRSLIIIPALVSFALMVIPFGRIIAAPLIVLATLFHEAGHGITAMALGCRFEELQLWLNGAGLATITGASSPETSAAIAAGGLIGPPLVGFMAFLAARKSWTTQLMLFTFGAGFSLLDIFFVRTLFSFIFIGCFAAAFLALAISQRAWAKQSILAFIGIQMAISPFSHISYLFSDSLPTSKGVMRSDVGAIAEALILPYWFWGALCALFSSFCLLYGLWIYIKK